MTSKQTTTCDACGKTEERPTTWWYAQGYSTYRHPVDRTMRARAEGSFEFDACSKACYVKMIIKALKGCYPPDEMSAALEETYSVLEIEPEPGISPAVYLIDADTVKK